MGKRMHGEGRLDPRRPDEAAHPVGGVRHDGLDRAPVHRAIDHLTAAQLETQALRRRLSAGSASAEDQGTGLRRLDLLLGELGAILLELRGEADGALGGAVGASVDGFATAAPNLPRRRDGSA